VLRLDLPQTASLLYSLWRLVPEADLLPGKILQMACLRCQQPMWVTTGKYGAYLKCQDCGLTRNLTPAIATQMAQISGVVCGQCGGMVKGRKSYNGVFLGCSRYPDCDWTMPIEAII
jgi:ssDNA-binding Zn-finger/Zn-ribbon topoisomerase 1